MKSPEAKSVAKDLSSDEDEVLTQELSQKSRKRRKKASKIRMPESSSKRKVKPFHQSVVRLRTFIDQAVSSPDSDVDSMSMNVPVQYSRRLPKRLSQLPCSQHSQSSTSRFHHPYSIVSASEVWTQQESQGYSLQKDEEPSQTLSQPDKRNSSVGTSPSPKAPKQSISPGPKQLSPRKSARKNLLITSPALLSNEDQLSVLGAANGPGNSTHQQSTPLVISKRKIFDDDVGIKTYCKKQRKIAPSTKSPNVLQGPLDSSNTERRGRSKKVASNTATLLHPDPDKSAASMLDDAVSSKKSSKLVNGGVKSTTKSAQLIKKPRTKVERTFDKLKKSLQKSSSTSAGLAPTPSSSQTKAKRVNKSIQLNINIPAPVSVQVRETSTMPKKQLGTHIRKPGSKLNRNCKGLKCGPPPCSSSCPRWKGDCKNWLNSKTVSKKMLNDECKAAGVKLTRSELNSFLKNVNPYLENMFDELSDTTSLAYGVFSFRDLNAACKKNGFFQGKNVSEQWLADQMRKFVGDDEKVRKQAEGIIYPSSTSKTFDTAQNFDNC